MSDLCRCFVVTNESPVHNRPATSEKPLGCLNTPRRPLEPDSWSLLASTGWGATGTPHNPVRLPLSVLDPRSAPRVLPLHYPRHEGGIHSGTHRSLWRARDRLGLTRGPRRPRVGRAPCPRRLSPPA